MAEDRLRFIHVSGLLIDHQLEQVGELPDELLRVVEEASFSALERLVDRALEDEVDFIILAGNSFDETDLSLRLPIALREACERLDEQEIRLFVLPGECDPVSAWLALGELPENLTLFTEASGESIAVFRNNRVIATVGYGEMPHEEVQASNSELPEPDQVLETHPSLSTSPLVQKNIGTDPAADQATTESGGEAGSASSPRAPSGEPPRVTPHPQMPVTAQFLPPAGAKSTETASLIPTTNVVPRPVAGSGMPTSPLGAANSPATPHSSQVGSNPSSIAAATSSTSSTSSANRPQVPSGVEALGTISDAGGNTGSSANGTGSKPPVKVGSPRRHPFAVRVQWLYPGMKFPSRLPEWVDYVALGGAHARRTAEFEQGRIHHPGEVFATPPTRGRGTASLVKVDENGVVSIRETALSPVVFLDQKFEMTLETTRQELLQRLARALATPVPADVEQIRIVRWQIRGSGSLFDSLRQQDFQRGFLEAVRKASGLRESIHVLQRVEMLSDGRCWNQAASNSRWAGEYLTSLDEQPPLSIEAFRARLATSGLTDESTDGLLLELCGELSDAVIMDRARRLGVQWFAGVPESGAGEPE